MTKHKLLIILRGLKGEDPESDHIEADNALLAFIGDDEITDAYNNIPTLWYA